MPLFFVLSGFVIHYNYAESIQTGGASALLNFFSARFARLYPLYFCAIAYDLINSYSYYQVKPHTIEALPFYILMI